jgi:D-arabinose 1-dehydrogenase-like Zn-dependent alcohol dehydrogenase
MSCKGAETTEQCPPVGLLRRGIGSEDPQRLVFWKQLQIIGSTMASRSEFEAMLQVALRGQLLPVIDSVLPLEQARAAHERLEAGEQFGKIVLTPGAPAA